LVGLQPDIIMTIASAPATVALQRETRTIPIILAVVADPVAQGIRQPDAPLSCFGQHLWF
jgi:ABC-type uncharacterized transport system substrate-binding protein